MNSEQWEGLANRIIVVGACLLIVLYLAGVRP